MSGTRILITGATGFTGKHACRYFAAAGYDVTAAVRSRLRTEEEVLEELLEAEGNAPVPPEMQKIRIVTCNLTDSSSVRELVESAKPDYVLHLAGMNAVAESWKQPRECMETNVLATIFLLDAVRLVNPRCRILTIGSMLGISAAATPPKPPHPYSLSKTMQVLAAQAWGHLFAQPVLLALPSNLIGPGPSNGLCGLLARWAVNLESKKSAESFTLSSYDEKRDFLDVRDAVSAYAAILLHGETGTVYQIGSGRQRSLGEVLETFRKLSPHELPVVLRPNPLTPPNPDPIDPAKVTELGWKPAYSFERSIADALHYFRQRRG